MNGSLTRRKEGGIVLILVLFGIVALMLAGIALTRASQTGVMIAGNFAFRQASLAANDTAIELAYAQLDTILHGDPNAAYPGGCSASNCIYYPLRQPTDVNGVPTVVGDWSSIPVNTVNTSYSTQYVIDRLCSGALPVTDANTNCFVGRPPQDGYSQNTNREHVTPPTQLVFYRISVRVNGPRNTVSLTQAIVSK